MRHLAADYLEQHAIPKKRPRSVENDRSMIDRIVLPRLGSKKVAAVQSRDIHALHVSMKNTPYQANRVLALLSKMFSLAVEWGWRSDNPVKGIERFQEERRERWLSDDELGRLLAVLGTHPNQRAANAVRLQLLTGARIGEVLSGPLVGHRFRARGLDQAFTSYEAEATEHISAIRASARACSPTMRERADPPRNICSRVMRPASRFRTSRSSGGRDRRSRRSGTTGCTTIGTPMLPTLFRAASALRSSGGFSATPTRRRRSAMPILLTTRCGPRRNGLEQSWTLSIRDRELRSSLSNCGDS